MTHQHQLRVPPPGAPSILLRMVTARAVRELNAQKERATDIIEVLAQAVRHTAQHLQTEQRPIMAYCLVRTAEQVEQAATALRHREIGDLLHEVQQFAKRQPVLFAGATFVVGVAAARFLKRSAKRALEYHREGSDEATGIPRYKPRDGALPTAK